MNPSVSEAFGGEPARGQGAKMTHPLFKMGINFLLKGPTFFPGGRSCCLAALGDDENTPNVPSSAA